MEITGILANPALKTIYNGKSLRENYSALNPNDVLYEGAIGALLGNIGGVNVMRTVGGAPGSDLSLPKSDFLYHAAMDDRAGGFGSTAIENSYLLPYSDTYNTPTSAMGISSTDALQDWIIGQYIAEIEKTKAADASERARYKELERKFLDGTITQEEGEELWRLEGTGKFETSSETGKNTPASEYAYYKELEHKYLRGNISDEEFEELRKLENVWGQFDAEVKENGTSVKERYRKLEQKFRNGNINEQEWNEMIRLENTLKQSDTPSKYAEIGLKAVQRESIGNRVTSVERYSKPAIIRIQNADLPNGLPIKGGAKTTVDKVDNSGVVLQRRIYGANGMAMKDFDTSDHNLPSAHPMGAHKHEFNYSKKKPRGAPLPLTEEELKEHGDIIKRGENYHDQK